MADAQGRPEDWPQRAAALEVDRSFIVQAPAGSGKTELLIQRLLALLGAVGQPEEILAITFTRKAAAEMRQRLIRALEAAQQQTPVVREHEKRTRSLALLALRNDRRQGWDLLHNPTRLQLMTIDSLCARLVRRMPWLSRFGAAPEVAEDPVPLFRRAAESLLEGISHKGASTSPLETLLRHLDNRADLLRDLLVDMLGRRDQWLRHLLGRRRESPREVLELGLDRYIRHRLKGALDLIGPDLREELSELLDYAAANLAAQNGKPGLASYAENLHFPDAQTADLEGWQRLVDLLLTAGGELRRTVTKNQGFPVERGNPEAAAMKSRMLGLLERLAEKPQLLQRLRRLRELPLAGYRESEWRLLAAMIQLLPLAVVELDRVFREQRQVDFIAVAGAARAALGEADSPEELLLQLDNRLSHILVDEFQDTSYGQYVLLEKLVSGWQPGDGRSLFVVGDPMQSIYRFREAEVGLYLRARRQGIGPVRLDPLQLTTNFRSQAGLVDWFNASFACLFPPDEDEARGAVSFSRAQSIRPELAGTAVSCHAFAERQDRAEADHVVDLVRQALAADGDSTVAILVRSRSHLSELTPLLQRAGLSFQAQEIVPLKDRPVILDLRALTRALLHRGDRVSWLAVLRAPWCGLLLQDLLWLCGDDRETPLIDLLQAPSAQIDLFAEPGPDSCRILARIVPILTRALDRRGRMPLRRLVESTWLELGGPACLAAGDLADAEQFFGLLAASDCGGEPARLEELDERLDRLYAAADPTADGRLQIMTMHKAKGLEFDTVIIPGLGRDIRNRDRTLLRWLEHPDFELLLAPIPAADGREEGQTYAAIGKLLQDKDDLETIRLLYVAATRARRRLHLLGHLRPLPEGSWRAASGSLLQAAWTALEDSFSRAPAAAEAADEGTVTLPALRRLPAGYRLPALPPTPPWRVTALETASDRGSGREGERRRFRLETSSGKLVGQVVHRWLEHWAGRVPAGWTPEHLQGRNRQIAKELLALGMTEKLLEKYFHKTMTCLKNILFGQNGRWLLEDYPVQASEFALTGVLDGRLVQAVIDRTFVTPDGTRWIADYKTSEPAADETLAAFLQREVERYRTQLQVYQRLMNSLEPQRTVRAGFYFPMLDHWQEVGLD